MRNGLIGPWIIQVNEKPYELNALTIIDTISNLVKLVRIDDWKIALPQKPGITERINICRVIPYKQ
jgi:hypothetical protein